MTAAVELTETNDPWSHVQRKLDVDRDSPVPLYHQLYLQLRQAISNRELKPGDRIEGEVPLARRLALSRPTVRRAIEALTNEGLLERHRGGGTTVSRHAAQLSTALPDALPLQVDHCAPRRLEVLQLSYGYKSEHAARALGLGSEEPLLYVERLLTEGSVPTAVLRSWLPAGLAEVTPAELRDRGILQLLEGKGLEPRAAHQVVGSRPATFDERRLLCLDALDCVMTLIRRSYDADGITVELGVEVYRMDTFRFEATTNYWMSA